MNCGVYSALLAAALLVGPGPALTAPGPDCSPAVIQELPARIRNMCAALYQFSSALQAYIDENPAYPAVLRELPRELPQREPFTDNLNSVKRQDMDHVFLRFGRRR